MNNCLRSNFLLAAFAAVNLGCSANNYPAPQPSSCIRTSILLLPSAHNNADEIGSLGPEAAPPTDLDNYRRPSAALSLQRVAIVRHPFR